MDVDAIATALGKKEFDRFDRSALKVGDIVRVIDQELESAGWIGSVTGLHLAARGYLTECRMNDDPSITHVFAPEQLMIVDRPLLTQKAVDPDHGKTLISENGARQSQLAFAVGSADPLAILAMAKVQAEGDAKYGRDNWRGIDEADHIAHALTHLVLHQAGDTEEEHLAHALIRVHMALAKHLRPDYYGVWKPNE